jgi:hypothetical protein
MNQPGLNTHWPLELVSSASPPDRDRLQMVDRFLTTAEKLTNDDWQTIYARFLAKRRTFDRALRAFTGASIDSILHSRRRDTPAQQCLTLFDGLIEFPELTPWGLGQQNAGA